MGGRRQRQAQLSKAADAMQTGQARALDQLAEYAEFQEMFLPAIRKALMGGASSEKILAQFKPLVAARLVQLGLTGSETAALGAIRELMDRVDGKAVQKQEHTHKLAKLPEQELDAVIQSKLKKLGQAVVETTGEVVEEEDE